MGLSRMTLPAYSGLGEVGGEKADHEALTFGAVSVIVWSYLCLTSEDLRKASLTF